MANAMNECLSWIVTNGFKEQIVIYLLLESVTRQGAKFINRLMYVASTFVNMSIFSTRNL